MPEVLMDCCRVAERLPVEALARDLGRAAPPPRAALALDGAALAALLRRGPVRGRALLYANGCAVAVGMDPQDAQALLVLLASSAPGADFERMLLLREMRTVPDDATPARAMALCGSVVLDALERKADLLLDQAERDLLRPRGFPAGRRARRRRHLARVAAFRYECVHGRGVLARPDTKWNLRDQAAYRALAAELRLAPRATLLSHKLDRLEALLLGAQERGQSGGMLRQLWLEVWLLLLFPLGRALGWALHQPDGYAWLQRLWRGLRLLW
jgi:hypothetical protein